MGQTRYLGTVDQFLGVSAKTSELPPLSLRYVRHGLAPADLSKNLLGSLNRRTLAILPLLL